MNNATCVNAPCPMLESRCSKYPNLCLCTNEWLLNIENPSTDDHSLYFELNCAVWLYMPLYPRVGIFLIKRTQLSWPTLLPILWTMLSRWATCCFSLIQGTWSWLIWVSLRGDGRLLIIMFMNYVWLISTSYDIEVIYLCSKIMKCLDKYQWLYRNF